MTAALDDLVDRLLACPKGSAGWHDFEEICTEILTHLFVPPLSKPIIQPRTFSQIDRRDAVFPNRNRDTTTLWGSLYQELGARLVLVEFKNYDKIAIGKDETNQTRNYMTKPMGRLALMVCNCDPDDNAHIKRNTIYSEDGKIILFITICHLREMCQMKCRGEDPCGLILDLVEAFYLQHE